jgi:hypothetical protein
MDLMDTMDHMDGKPNGLIRSRRFPAGLIEHPLDEDVVGDIGLQS